MELTIYNSNGVSKATVSANDSSTQEKVLMGDNVLTLSFTHHSHIVLDVNDYVNFRGERYWLMERYAPQMKNTQEWAYDLKLYGIESLTKRFLVLNTTDGDSEPVFTLTAPASEHLQLIVDCLNDGMGNTTDWKVGEVDAESENIVIDYHGKYCDEALKELAEKAGTEWWIEGTTVNLCKCETGTELRLEHGSGLVGLEPSSADNVKVYTRLFPIGSTRNIDPTRYGHSRLQLPDGAKYVDVNIEKYGIIHHYEQEAFNGIYPRRTGRVTDVRHEDVVGEDGNTFRIYYFKDSTMTFDPNEYELAGEVKRVSFQEGSELAGLGEGDDHYFEVNYDSATHEFEIITIWPYDDDTQLPGGSLVPAINDEYILWNIRMPDQYYALAEEELAGAVDEYNAKHALDVSVYKSKTDHVWFENHNEDIDLGRRVKLVHDTYFDSGYRQSRVTKLTRKVNEPLEIDIEVGDCLSSSALEKLNSDIGDVKSYAKSIKDGQRLPGIIRSWDNTMATDNNLYSARRSREEFLSKKTNDRARGKIIFEQGIDLGDYVAGEYGGSIDEDGNGDLLSLIVRQLLRSTDFVSGFDGEGWKLWIDSTGLSNLEIDKLTVRHRMLVMELLVDKIRSVGGQVVVSAANGKIKSAEEEDGYWAIEFENGNEFQAGDLIRCQTFSGGEQKSWWVEVAAVEGDHILVSSDEFGEYAPAAGDECVLMGNTQNTSRQNLILVSATEDGQPRIDVLGGVDSKGFAGCLRTRLGNLDGISDSQFPADRQPQGDGLYSDNAYLKGTFVLSTGEDVKTRFEIVEGKVESAVEGLREDFVADKGYLNNPTFHNGMDRWQTENECVFFLLGNKWIWANKHPLSKRGSGASVVKDDGRTVVRIKNKWIEQKNASLRVVPTMTQNDDGDYEAQPVYLSFFYRCAKAGHLHVKFEDVDKTGFANFNSLDVEEDLTVTEGYKQYTCNGLWNGTGDFKLSFTGDIYLYMLVLTTDRVEALTYKYRTLLEQSDKLVKIAAGNFDQNGNVLEESGIMVKSEGTGIYAQGPDGKLALIGVGVEENYTDSDGEEKTRTVIKLTADNIKLEGLVTANNYFKILPNGSIEATNGKFSGQMNAQSGYIGGFVISDDHIGVGSVTYEEDEDGNMQPVVKDDTEGLFLYDNMIGFNDSGRQALFGTWSNLGQPMLCRLIDTHKEPGMNYDILPKYGIVFDIRNSAIANLAFAGNGNGALNGFVDGFKFKKVNVNSANSIYDIGLSDSNRIIVNCTVSNAGIALPRLSSVRGALGIGNSTPFALRLTIMSDLGSTNNFSIYGRNTKPNSSGEKPWNSDDYPLFTHWDGGKWESLAMGEGDTIEVLLVYDPERTDTLDGFTTKYTARCINRQD
jgi:hypothetical protein